MTCPCDNAELPTLETAQSVLHTEALAIDANSPNPLPDICEIEPYRVGATTAQKKCHTSRTLLMLARWIWCSGQSNPIECFDGYCEDYADQVDACYAT